MGLTSERVDMLLHTWVGGQKYTYDSGTVANMAKYLTDLRQCPKDVQCIEKMQLEMTGTLGTIYVGPEEIMKAITPVE